MCKEDVRIGRKVAIGASKRVSIAGNNVQIGIPANANRYSVSIVARYAVVTAGISQVIVCTGNLSTSLGTILGAVSPENPSLIVELTRQGQAALEPINVYCSDALTEVTLDITEYVFLQPLEDV